MTIPVFVLNGPNLNMLGTREPGIYGGQTLADIERDCVAAGRKLGLAVDFRQTNHEGVLVDWIQEARSKASGVIVNPGGYSHTSVAIYDAFKALDRPIIEVHLSNPNRREEFRHRDYVSMVATGVIAGLGPAGYLAAVDAMAELVKS